MTIDMHIFSARMQYGHKCIHFSSVTYGRHAHVHFPCRICKISPFTCRVCMCCIIHSHVPCFHINPLWYLYLVAVCWCSSSDTFVRKIFLVCSANLCYPTTRLRSYFSNIFAAHLRVYTRTMWCKRSLKSLTNFPWDMDANVARK